MVYALNLYNIVQGQEAQYKHYLIEAGKVLRRVGASVVISGNDPIQMVTGDKLRKHLIVVQFPNEEAFALFLELVELGNLNDLRENATDDYIWTLYEDWNLHAWVNE